MLGSGRRRLPPVRVRCGTEREANAIDEPVGREPIHLAGADRSALGGPAAAAQVACSPCPPPPLPQESFPNEEWSPTSVRHGWLAHRSRHRDGNNTAPGTHSKNHEPRIQKSHRENGAVQSHDRGPASIARRTPDPSAGHTRRTDRRHRAAARRHAAEDREGA